VIWGKETHTAPKIQGESYIFPFSFTLPSEVDAKEREDKTTEKFRLPASFSEQHIKVGVSYYLDVDFHLGGLHKDKE